MQVEPEQEQRRDPEQAPGTLLSGVEQPQQKAGQRKREHLRTHAPGRRRSQSAENGRPRRPVGFSGTPPVEQHETRRRNQRRKHDQPGRARVLPEFVENDFRQPLVRDPGLSGTSERERIGVRDVPGLHDPLPGAQVPPEIGIGGWPGRNAEQPQEQQHRENFRKRKPACPHAQR